MLDDLSAAPEMLDFCNPALLTTTFEASALEKWLLTLVLDLVETEEEHKIG